jgi:hypothetical protein
MTARAMLEFDERPSTAAAPRRAPRPICARARKRRGGVAPARASTLVWWSSRESVLQGLANFGIGTLVPSLQGRFAARCLLGKLDLGGRDKDLGAGLEIGRFQQRLLLGRPIG